MKKKAVKQKTKGYLFYPLYLHTGGDEEVSVEYLAEISDFNIFNKITPETRGVSPDFRVRSFACSICHQNFENCEHENGQEYNGMKCYALMDDWEIMNFAIVSKPEHPQALISDIIIIEYDQGRIKHTWRGFRDSDENARFKRIQRLLDQRIISERAAKFFSRFFSINLEGTAVYPQT